MSIKDHNPGGLLYNDVNYLCDVEHDIFPPQGQEVYVFSDQNRTEVENILKGPITTQTQAEFYEKNFAPQHAKFINEIINRPTSLTKTTNEKQYSPEVKEFLKMGSVPNINMQIPKQYMSEMEVELGADFKVPPVNVECSKLPEKIVDCTPIMTKNTIDLSVNEDVKFTPNKKNPKINKESTEEVKKLIDSWKNVEDVQPDLYRTKNKSFEYCNNRQSYDMLKLAGVPVENFVDKNSEILTYVLEKLQRKFPNLEISWSDEIYPILLINGNKTCISGYNLEQVYDKSKLLFDSKKEGMKIVAKCIIKKLKCIFA